MSSEKTPHQTLDLAFYPLALLTIIMPIILPDYPLSLMDSLFLFPSFEDVISMLLFLMLAILSATDLLIVFLIKVNRFLKSSRPEARELFAFSTVASIFLYAIILDFLVYVGSFNSPFKIYFILLAVSGYALYKFL